MPNSSAGTPEALTCVRYRRADADPAKYKSYRQQQEDSSSRKLDQACHWQQEKPQRHLLMARDAVRTTRARKRCISTLTRATHKSGCQPLSAQPILDIACSNHGPRSAGGQLCSSQTSSIIVAYGLQYLSASSYRSFNAAFQSRTVVSTQCAVEMVNDINFTLNKLQSMGDAQCCCTCLLFTFLLTHTTARSCSMLFSGLSGSRTCPVSRPDISLILPFFTLAYFS